MDITPGETTLTLSQENFALHVEEVTSNNFEGITFSTNSRRNFQNGRVGSTSGSSVPSDAVVSIVLPPSTLSGSGSQRIGFSLYDDGTLFQPRNTAKEFQGLDVGGVFISATVYGSIATGLSDPVTARFLKSTVCLNIKLKTSRAFIQHRENVFKNEVLHIHWCASTCSFLICSPIRLLYVCSGTHV